jgi:hypothetical protein
MQQQRTLSEVRAAADSSSFIWNQLLAELSQLSRIVEQSGNDGNHESSTTAASQQNGM